MNHMQNQSEDDSSSKGPERDAAVPPWARAARHSVGLPVDGGSSTDTN